MQRVWWVKSRTAPKSLVVKIQRQENMQAGLLMDTKLIEPLVLLQYVNVVHPGVDSEKREAFQALKGTTFPGS